MSNISADTYLEWEIENLRSEIEDRDRKIAILESKVITLTERNVELDTKLVESLRNNADLKYALEVEEDRVRCFIEEHKELKEELKDLKSDLNCYF